MEDSENAQNNEPKTSFYVIHLAYDEMGRLERSAWMVYENSINKDDLLSSLTDPVNPQFIRFRDCDGDFHIYRCDRVIEIHGHDYYEDEVQNDGDDDDNEGEKWKLGLGSADKPNP